MPQEIEVVSIVPRTNALVRTAVATLNKAQSAFVFVAHARQQTEPGGEAATEPEQDALGEWSADVLAKRLGERMFASGHPVIGVLDERLESNWFTRRTTDERATFITTCNWEILTPYPVLAFLTFQIAAAAARGRAAQPPLHEDLRGCMQDLCGFKPDFGWKLRTGDLCHDCAATYRSRLSPAEYEALLTMLDAARRIALDRPGATPSTERSLLQTVDLEYPFPIAYCVRSLQTERGYTRKLYQLFEVSEAALKYASFVFLASGVTTKPAELEKLRRATMGTWQNACFQLAGALDETNGGFLHGTADALGKTMSKAKAASRELCEIRNQIAHGSAPSDTRAQQIVEETRPKLETLLAWMAPLTTFPLIRPDGLGTRRGGVSLFSAKVLMGSHPTFQSRDISTAAVFDTDCTLYEPATGRFVSLFPWITFEHCASCGHESVLMYDSCERNKVVYRESGKDHRHDKTDALPEVERRLGPR